MNERVKNEFNESEVITVHLEFGFTQLKNEFNKSEVIKGHLELDFT
jgi:hypothetical protein